MILKLNYATLFTFKGSIFVDLSSAIFVDELFQKIVCLKIGILGRLDQLLVGVVKVECFEKMIKHKPIWDLGLLS